MNFWTYCEKVTGCVGFTPTFKNIELVRKYYLANKTVGQCAEAIQKLN